MVNGVGGLDDPAPRGQGQDGPAGRQHRTGRRLPGRPDRGVLGSDHPVGLPLRGRHRSLRPAPAPSRRPGGPGRGSPAAIPTGARGGLRADLRRARYPHRQPGPAAGAARRSSPRWTWPAGVPPWCRGRSSTPGCCPIPSGSSGSRTSTSSAGCARRGSRCWSTTSPPVRWPATRHRRAGRRHWRTADPTDDDEAWRSYYHARNSFALIRRHGRPSWYAWQLAYSARQLQTAGSRAERAAIAHGLWDGALGRMGENPRYGRRVGEFGRPNDSEPGSPATT